VWTATRFTRVDTAVLGGLRLLRPFRSAGLRRDMRHRLAALKRVLERA
jgi:hypothetical protein